jgi:hypothetical protein
MFVGHWAIDVILVWAVVEDHKGITIPLIHHPFPQRVI